MAESKPNMSFAEKLALNLSIAVMSQSATAPLDRVKLLLQCDNELVNNGRLNRVYTGPVDCVTRIYQREGLLSFLRGNLAAFITYFPNQALTFALRSKIHRLMNFGEQDGDLLTFVKNISSGILTGTIVLIFIYPFDVARIHLAADVVNDAGERRFNGILDVWKHVSCGGLVGLYRGFLVSCVGITVYRASFYILYRSVESILLDPDSSDLKKYLVGYLVTVAAGLLSYPIDTVRSRMILSAGESDECESALDCARRIREQEGGSSFMKGFGVNILRGVFGVGVLVLSGSVKKLYMNMRS